MNKEIDYLKLFIDATRVIRKDNTQWLVFEQELKQKKISKSDAYFCLEKSIEESLPLNVIKLLFEYCDKDEAANNNLFKWACGFSSIDIIKYLEDKVPIDQYGAVQAAISAQRATVIEYLSEKGFPVFRESFLDMVIVRTATYNGNGYINALSNFYFKNLTEITDLSNYSIERLNKFIEDKSYKSSEIKECFNNVKINIERILQSRYLNNTLDSKEKKSSVLNKI